MARTKFGPGGGAFPTRQDEKIANEHFVFGYPGYNTDENPNHHSVLRRIKKRAQTKKRRQRDRCSTIEQR